MESAANPASVPNSAPATPNAGTDFSCTPAQRQQYWQVRQQRLVCKLPHFLVVEDQAFSRGLLHSALSAHYTLDEVANIQQGWGTFLEQSPDIIFLDIDLNGKSGHDLAHHIKAFDPMAYVVMVTASHLLEDVRTAKSNQVDGFIAKPFSKQKIDEVVQKYFARGRK